MIFNIKEPDFLMLNKLVLEQNVRHFAYDILNCFYNENVHVLFKIWIQFFFFKA